jgi:hypothetical protein
MKTSKILIGSIVTIILFILTVSGFGEGKNNHQYKD